MRINTSRGHLPLQHLLRGSPSVRSLDCSDEALSKRLSTKCSDPQFPYLLPASSGYVFSGFAILGSAWIVYGTVGDNRHVG